MSHEEQQIDPGNGGDAIFRSENGTRYSVSTHVVTMFLLIATTIAVWVYFSPLTLDINSPDFNPIVGLVVLLGIGAAREGVQAMRSWLRNRKFGVSALELRDRSYAVLGQELRGTIHLPAGLRPSGPYELLLECLEIFGDLTPGHTPRIVLRRSPEGKAIIVRWKSRQLVQTSEAVPSIPVRFQLPTTDPVQETNELRRGVVRWELEVRAQCEGLDYKARFVVPVFDRDIDEIDTKEAELDKTSGE